MCLAAFAVGAREDLLLVVAANRDESHLRPAAGADWWAEPAGILGGRDMEAGGSWLAVDRLGRLAAVTNRPAPRGAAFAASRGHLVSDYLAARDSPQGFCARLAETAADYAPCNLVLFDGRRLFHAANRSGAQRLAAGIHVLSNAPLGTRWPKTAFAASRLTACVAAAGRPEALVRQLFAMLETRQLQGDGGERAHPDWRRRAVFVTHERYGTRAATVVLVTRDGEVTFAERCFGSDGRRQGERTFHFRAAPASFGMAPSGGPRANR